MVEAKWLNLMRDPFVGRKFPCCDFTDVSFFMDLLIIIASTDPGGE